MRITFLLTFIVVALVGCATAPATYQVGDRQVQGASNGAELIAERITAAAAAQTVGVDQSPKVLHSVAPVPPAEVVAGGIGGQVVVELTIDRRGSVSDVKILQSPDPRLSEAVVTAVKKWTFSPLIEYGAPQEFKARQTFEFRVEP